jgi:AraC-like DNA-binding protein
MDAESLAAAFAPGADHVMPFHIVTSGPVWFEVPSGERVQASEDDVVVFPKGADHILTDRPGSTPIRVPDLMHEVSGNPPTLVHGGNGDAAGVLCGFFHCRGRLFNPLLDSLPDVLLVTRDDERTPWLAATMRRAFTESMSGRLGSEVLVERLTESLFVEVVQRYLEGGDVGGWLRGLSDQIVGPALAMFHAEPARDWTLDDLANGAGTSRAVLSQRFNEQVGIPPIRYLTAWRMELAGQQLVRSQQSIAEIAADVGYASEAAFNKAFKRHVGEPPASWRRRKLGAA